MYGALGPAKARTPASGPSLGGTRPCWQSAKSGASTDGQVPPPPGIDDDDSGIATWEAGHIVAVSLQLFLWIGAWGVVDCVVEALATTSGPESRFTIYLLISASGGLAASLLLWVQQKLVKSSSALRRARHEGIPFQFPCGASSTLLVAGFATAVALCAGLWGMVDSAIKVVVGDNNDNQLKGYMILTVIVSLGVAVHHRFWPHQVLGAVGKLTIV